MGGSAFAADDPWKPWIEPDFPFFSSGLDLRPQSPKDAKEWNITPRGIVLNLGNDCWACFDTDLLRVSAIWTGKGVTEDSLAPLSYQNKPLKTVGGQSKLPKPDGKVWLMNGVYPGWQLGDKVSFDDPREPQPSPEEPGRGPIPPSVGQFKAVRLNGHSAVLDYTVDGAEVEEQLQAGSRGDAHLVTRALRLAPCPHAVSLVLGHPLGGDAAPKVNAMLVWEPKGSATMEQQDGTWVAHIPAHEKPLEFTVFLSEGGEFIPKDFIVVSHPAPSINRWPQEVVTKATLSTSKDAFVEDEIPLPLNNPWKRNVRMADVAFFKDGTAAGVTVDGDVWLIRGLGKDLGEVHWKRFASGLHEPMGIAIRDEQIYVFDRNGIWRLRDTNNDGVADVHELFCNAFPQSAESREFPMSMRLAPDGSFVISKGGQQASTISKLNGSVLRIAADGKSYEILGVGFRQPFIGVNPRTGLVTASDQEGNYVPTTPLYIVKGDEYHGFLSELLPKEKYPAPIADPLTWIPHPVNPSAATQTWLIGANMGPLNDSLIHVAFNRPELFSVLLNERGTKPQAAVVSVVHDFDIPVLNAKVNPADGWVYMTGFQVIGWGTTATRVSGFGRVRYTGATCTVPKEVIPMDKGVLLRFDTEVDPQKAADPASYTLESWHYKRTYKYGSPHLKADETPGQDWITPSSAYVSKDGKSVFVGVPGMKPVQQMRIGWGIVAKDGTKLESNAFFTPYELVKFNPTAEGFGDISVDLTAKATVAQASAPASAEEGKRLYQLMGCMACHAIDDTIQPKIGPPWKGLYGKTVQISKGPDVVADDAYIRESILVPSAKIVKGYEKVEAGMPVYQGVLSESQIQSIILYIKTLK
ncbi:cytochrome c class I [Chthoniobacter flavus Ellin428]|uniref:Cytochrome c class I n=2 Tax=Chthoniobacter flavus TaxID=191863 RepID=B4DC91_9BACT|nr:cytochrome c class I [Chthoniobacter flavus Ellin428]TCO82512.1 cytochrome c [Chthoniobacter flavus]